MNFIFVHLLFVALALPSCTPIKPAKSKIVKCSVCRNLVAEVHSAILEVDPRKKIDIGSYRLEGDGKQKLSSVKYAGSEIHMMEVLENVCKNMDDYVQVKHKETGRMEVIRLVINGAMNPLISEYDMIQDPDLNKILKFHCTAIIEDFEDEIMSFFKDVPETSLTEMQDQFCNSVTDVCVNVKDEL